MIRKRKRWKLVFPLISFFMLAFLWGGAAFFIPNEISLMEGKEQDFEFSLPMKAKVQDENIGVLNINHTPVKDNIHIDLNRPFTIKPEGIGSAKVSLSLFGLMPVKTVNAYILPETAVIPSGQTVGVSMDTRGIMVLGTGFVSGENNEVFEPSKGILKSGDMILQAGKKQLQSKEDLMSAVEENGTKAMELLVERKGQKKVTHITPVYSREDNCYKIGVWVRDSTQGIGTVTFYDPESGGFGALGHGVYDIDTKELMSIKKGKITQSSVKEIKKGEKGVPGELLGEVGKEQILGDISVNTEVGLYGEVKEGKEKYFKGQKVPVALQQEIQEGSASILANIEGEKVEEFAVEIEDVCRYSNNETKGMVVKITDEKLLKKTGGIVQGMSGSPILQNGKLIGAVTHVFVQDPAKGYGIFIENMLKQERKVA